MFYLGFLDDRASTGIGDLLLRYSADEVRAAHRWFEANPGMLPRDPGGRDDPYADAMAVWEAAGRPDA